MNFEIDTEDLKKGFSSNELIIYSYIKQCVKEKGCCNETQEKMAEKLNIPVRTLIRNLQSLAKSGFIENRAIVILK